MRNVDTTTTNDRPERIARPTYGARVRVDRITGKRSRADRRVTRRDRVQAAARLADQLQAATGQVSAS